MTSKELIEAHIRFLEKNMKCDSIVQPSLIKDDTFEIKAYKKVLKDLEEKEKQDKILNALLKNADYHYDEWYGMRGNQCIMIGITEKDECFEEIREMVENYGKD